MNVRAAAALVAAPLLLAFGSAAAQDAKPAPNVDPRALELLRKADRTTYRPTAAGLKSLRCSADYVMTSGVRYRIAYAMESPGKSTIALQATESEDADAGSEKDRMKEILDDLFDGPRLETKLAKFSLAWKEIDGRAVVLATESNDDAPTQYRFLPEGPLEEESPTGKFERIRTRWKYEAAGDVFVRKSATLDGYGKGAMSWKLEDVGGVKIPTRYSAFLGGLGGTMTLRDVEVNVPVAGPATLEPPAPPPTQEALDALDVDSLMVMLRAPFVGRSPNSVKTLRIVRAFAKKGDDAKRAIASLVTLLAYDRGEPPATNPPADFEEFHPPLVELLARLRPESIRPLIGAMKSPITDQREWAAVALGLMGADAAPALDALVEALDDEMWMVAFNAAAAARKVGCPAERALPTLLRRADVWWMGEGYADEAIAFADADPDGDRKLVAAFVACGVAVERDDDGRVRGVELLFKKRGARLARLLDEASKKAPASRGDAIARALVACGDPARDALERRLDGADDGPRLAALRAAAWAGKDAAFVAAHVVPRLDGPSESADAAEAALVAIGAAAAPDVERFVASRPASGDDPVRDRARRILDRIRAR